MRVSPFVLTGFLSLFCLNAATPAKPAVKSETAKLVDSYGRLALAFEENQGQTSSEARYFARAGGYSIWLTHNGAVIGQAGHEPMRLRLAGSRAAETIQAFEKLPGVANYFTGNDRTKWRTNIPTYGRVVYRGIYPGVEVAYYGRNGQLEYDFDLAPGADAGLIRVVHEGARTSHLTPAGDLILRTGFGEVTMKKPVAWQAAGSKRKEIAVRYEVRGEEIRFALGGYDKRAKLTIDPVVVYTMQIVGGIPGTSGIAVDNQGAAYITGITGSTLFPIVATPLQPAYAGNGDVFIAKLNSQGTALVYATYFGGAGIDQGVGIAVDSTGAAYVAGTTQSTDFPVLNAAQATKGGNADAFALKLNPAGNALVYSTFLGGGDQDKATGLAIDGAGQAYVTGTTQSNNFPTVAALQGTFGGGVDMFVTRLNTAGGIAYSTYIGGSGNENPAGIAVDTAGAAYLTGFGAINSLPLVNALFVQPGANGGAFVTKINAAGSALEYSTFLGADYNNGNAITVDATGAAYVTGSTSTILTLTSFLTKVAPNGFGLAYTKSFNGTTRSVSLDPTGAAIVSNCVIVGSDGLEPIFALNLEKYNPAGNARMYSYQFAQRSCGMESTGSGDPVTVDASGAAYVFTNAGYVSKVTPGITLPVQLFTQVTPAGCGTVTTSPGPMDGSDNYFQMSTAVLVSANGTGCFFSGWAGDLAGLVNPQVLTLNSSRAVTAVFTQCAFFLNPSGSLSFNSSAATQNINVTTTLGCAWNVTPSVPWVTATVSGTGIGTGVLTLTIAANTTNVQRQGIVTIGNQSLFINQAGTPACSYGVTPTIWVFNEDGGIGTLTVGALPGCTWTPVTPADWITITNPGPGINNGTVRFSAAPNTGYARNTTLTIGGIDVRITQAASPSARGLAFQAMTPCRLMETRAAYNFEGRTGAFGPPFLRAGETRNLNLSNSICPVPANARAYVLNVTLIPKTNVDFVTVYPGGESLPAYATVRSPDGQTVANSAIVKAGNGGVAVYASNDADVLIDISGVFVDRAATSNLVFYPLTPCRVVETRSDYRPPVGPFGPPTMNAGESRRFRFPVTPYCTVPAGASAYSVTVTAVPPQALAYMTIWPSGAGQPNVSTINSFAGRTLANSVIVPASADGSIDVFASDRTDFLVDINGYFAPDDGLKGQYYFPVTQCRATDTTDATLTGPFGPPIYADETARTIPLLASSRCSGIPPTAKAYAVNVTAIPGGLPMPFLTVYPSAEARPNSSILNAFQGQTVTNAAIIPAGANGSIDVYAFRRTNVIVELSGYFGR